MCSSVHNKLRPASEPRKKMQQSGGSPVEHRAGTNVTRCYRREGTLLTHSSHPLLPKANRLFFLLCKATHYSSFEGTQFANFIRGQRKGHIEKDCFGEDGAKGRKIFREKEKKKAL